MKNNKKQSEVSSFFILLDVLKWNLVNPLWFLIKSKITFKKFKKDIKLDLPEDFINSSGFLAWLYIRLKKDVGQERAFEIIRDGVLKLGLAVQQVNLKNVEEKKIFENLKKKSTIR